MKFIKQTISSNKNGNCLAACIASLLEKNINDFPEIPNNEKWFDSMNE